MFVLFVLLLIFLLKQILLLKQSNCIKLLFKGGNQVNWFREQYKCVKLLFKGGNSVNWLSVQFNVIKSNISGIYVYFLYGYYSSF